MKERVLWVQNIRVIKTYLANHKIAFFMISEQIHNLLENDVWKNAKNL